jgi:hypothetical protein
MSVNGIRGRRGNDDRVFVCELSVRQLGLLVDVLGDHIRETEHNSVLFDADNDWTIDYELAKSRELLTVRHMLYMADPKEVVADVVSDEE